MSWVNLFALLVSSGLLMTSIDAFSCGSFKWLRSPRTTRIIHQRGSDDALRMVSTEPMSLKSKYPTARGSEVDSRKIIAGDAAGRQHLTAVRLSHILFASEEMADNSLEQLRSASMAFDTLAQQISNCVETREQGGSVGWVAVHEEGSNVNDHLDLILPPEARMEAIQMTTKVLHSIKVNACCMSLQDLLFFLFANTRTFAISDVAWGCCQSIIVEGISPGAISGCHVGRASNGSSQESADPC